MDFLRIVWLNHHFDWFYVTRMAKLLLKNNCIPPFHGISYGLVGIMDALTFLMSGLDDILVDELPPTCQWFLLIGIPLKLDIRQKRASWWFYPLAIFVPGATFINAELQVEALAKHTKATWSKPSMHSPKWWYHTNSKNCPSKLDVHWCSTAAQGGNCALIKTECCISIPNFKKCN